jgi:hypothetical protein
MNNQEKKANIAHIVDVVDPQAPRTPDALLGIDDIGLPEDIVPEGARKPEQIEPEADSIDSMKGEPWQARKNATATRKN